MQELIKHLIFKFKILKATCFNALSAVFIHHNEGMLKLRQNLTIEEMGAKMLRNQLKQLLPSRSYKLRTKKSLFFGTDRKYVANVKKNCWQVTGNLKSRQNVTVKKTWRPKNSIKVCHTRNRWVADAFAAAATPPSAVRKCLKTRRQKEKLKRRFITVRDI